MGTVYVATHARLGHVVGIKVLHPQYQQDEDLRTRFVDEAKIQANLRHPNILSVQDIVESESTAGIVMEFLYGCSLDAFYDSVGLPLPLPRLLKLFSTLAGALHYAHEKGVVHRDLKPSNVYLHCLHDEVVPKVMDFGIAKLHGLGGAGKLTTAGAVMGTPAYMAPEQLEDASTVDHRADVYSLGVMLYEAATGTLPFGTENMAGLMKDILISEPKRPSLVHRSCPPQLDAIIMKCLDKDRTRRFPGMADLQEALKRLGHEVGFEGFPCIDVPRRDLVELGILLPGQPQAEDTFAEVEALTQRCRTRIDAPQMTEADTIVASYKPLATGDLVHRPGWASASVGEPRKGDKHSAPFTSGEPQQGDEHTVLPTWQLRHYRIVERIYSGTETVVYRAIDARNDNRPVIVKVLNTEYPSPDAVARLKHEYALTRDLQVDGVARTLALEKFGNGLALILEDFGGVMLKTMIAAGPLSLEAALKTGCRLAGILAQIHAAGIVHKDLNPRNIVVNPQTDQLKVIDFGLATGANVDGQEAAMSLTGTIAYISPEQTGRMNRPVDFRTDFYSLGVTIYELATGHLPFETEDRVELVHCHLARQARPASEVNPSVPQQVADVVAKLMAKNAEDRYQSARGIQADLDECLRQWQRTGKVVRFPLAAREVSDRFQIPHKLYGREAEVETLISAFGRVAQGGRELMLVRGYAGIGKTSLVREVQKPITRQRGYFISGKFDQYKRDIPYGALADAFRTLVKELLSEGDEQLSMWRARILQALGPNASVISSLIPEVELVIGRTSPVPELQAAEARNRLNIVFSSFIAVFARPEHPLVLFLDDLQWADNASLDVLHLLLTGPESKSLFLVGAYRDNEVDAAHPLAAASADMTKAGAAITDLCLKPLSPEHVERLVADTIGAALEEARPLAEAVHARTGGNPFFIGELLKTLHSQGLISFDASGPRWVFDLPQIKAQGVSEDVVELMATKMRRMAPTSQQALQLGACIGGHFDLQTLVLVSGRSPGEIIIALKEAVREGLILLSGEAYRFIELDSADLSGGLLDAVLLRAVHYRFSHDKIQQAAYSLLRPEVAIAVHRQIGTHVLKETPPEKLEQRIFDIVNQLNASISMAKSEADRDELARLNLVAGRRAKGSSAYRSSLTYLETGISLLGEGSFDRIHDVAIGLYCEAAEAAYLSTRFEDMEKYVAVVIANSRDLDERVKAYEVQIQGYIAQAKKWEAIRTALPVLKMLGFSLPEKPSMIAVLRALLNAKFALLGKGVEQLAEAPEMTRPNALSAMRVATRIASTAYVVSPNLFPVLVLKQVELSARYGCTPLSSFAYALYGTILCGVLGQVDLGYRFGKLALKILSRYNAAALKPRSMFTVTCTTQHFKEHYDRTIPAFREAFKASLEVGDPEFVGCNAGGLAYALFFSGKNLEGNAKEAASFAEIMAQFKQAPYERYARLMQQSALNLIERRSEPWVLSGAAMTEAEVVAQLEGTNDSHGMVIAYLYKCLLAIIFDKPRLAVEFADKADPHLFSTKSMIPNLVFGFYDSLARLGVYSSADAAERKAISRRVAKNQKMLRTMAKHTPMNYQHRWHLVQAELDRVNGRTDSAIGNYDRSIEQARENGFVNDEALAGELAAKFYLGTGKTKIARTYMSDAHHAYTTWGATGKAKQLERTYPELLADILSVERARDIRGTVAGTITTSSSDSSSSSARDRIDVAVVMRATNAMASEKRLDLLLERIMKILMDTCGAQRALLALDTEGTLYVEAETKVEGDAYTVLQHVPIRNRTDLPAGVINYVMRLRDAVALDNAMESTEFARDTYVAQGQVKSLLCLPLVHQNRLAGIAYLENRLAAGVFSPSRVEMARMLASQMVVSIENARLQAKLEAVDKPNGQD